jgi:hypothetical protein
MVLWVLIFVMRAVLMLWHAFMYLDLIGMWGFLSLFLFAW